MLPSNTGLLLLVLPSTCYLLPETLYLLLLLLLHYLSSTSSKAIRVRVPKCSNAEFKLQPYCTSFSIFSPSQTYANHGVAVMFASCKRPRSVDRKDSISIRRNAPCTRRSVPGTGCTHKRCAWIKWYRNILSKHPVHG